MGLGAPEIILILTALLLLLIFPVWGYRAGSKRTIGGAGGLLLGVFFNLLGVAIVYCTSKIDEKKLYNFPGHSPADDLQKYKQLLESGAITEAEYNIQKSKILNA